MNIQTITRSTILAAAILLPLSSSAYYFNNEIYSSRALRGENQSCDIYMDLALRTSAARNKFGANSMEFHDFLVISGEHKRICDQFIVDNEIRPINHDPSYHPY